MKSKIGFVKIFMAIFSCLTMVSLIPLQQVIAADVIYTVSFESGTPGSQYSDSHMNTYKVSGNASVSTYGAHGGTKSYETSEKIEYFSIGALVTEYTTDDGNQYTDVVCNSTHAFVASQSGFIIYYISDGTFIDMYVGSFYAVDQDYNGYYFATCTNTSGIYVFNFSDGTTLTKITEVHHGTAGNNYWGIWFDQSTNNVHVTSDEGVICYTWNGFSTLTYNDMDNQGGNYRDVIGDGTYIYVADPSFGYGVLAYSFAGTYTYIAAGTDGWADQVWDLYCDGTYIYTANLYNGTVVFSFDGFSFTEEYRTLDGTEYYYNINGNGTHVFYGCSADGFRMYTLYDGASMVLVAESDVMSAGGSGRDVCTNDNKVIGATSNEGIYIYQFVPSGTSYHYTSASNLFNFTYSSSQFLTNLTFYHSAGWCNDVAYTYMYFYNSTHGSIADPIIKIYEDVNANTFSYYEGAIPTDMGRTLWNTSGFVQFGFKVYSDGSVNYTLGSSNFDADVTDVSQIAGDYRIDKFFFLTSSYYQHHLFDDFSITISDEYPLAGSGGLSYCGFDMSNTSQLAFDDATLPTWACPNPWIEYGYDWPIRGQAVGVAMYVGTQHYGTDPDLYWLYLNGDLYLADCIDYVDADTCYVFWSCNTTLNNEKPVFELEHITPVSGSTYWYPTYTTVGGEGFMTRCKGLMSYANGIWDGTLMSSPYRLGQLIMYYIPISAGACDSPFDDLITTNSLTFEQYENIPLIWFKGNCLYQYTIEVWHDGSEITDLSYPFPYTLPSGQYCGWNGYVPLDTGTYTFVLTYDAVNVSTITVTVVASTHPDFIIYTHPNPCLWQNTFSIGYRYFTDDGERGAISADPYVVTDFFDLEKIWFVNSNTTGNITYKAGNDYWIYMYKSLNDTYYLTPYENDYHAVLTSLFKENTLHLSDTEKYIDYPEGFNLTITGYQTFYDLDGVALFIDGIRVTEVGKSPFYEASTSINTDGEKSVTLQIYTVNGSIIIANETLRVSYNEGEGTTPPSSDPFDVLFGEYKYVFAIGIIVMFVLMPMVIAARLGIELPLMVNLGSGAIGMSFVVLSGILPLWVIFFTAVVMVAGGIIYVFMRG